MGKFHLLAIGSLGEAWVYPENRIDPTNPLGIRNRDLKQVAFSNLKKILGFIFFKRSLKLFKRHCRRQDFPLLEFSTFENSCFNMTDTEMVEGTECQFECDTGTIVKKEILKS